MAKVKNILGRGEPVSMQNIQYDFVTLASHQLRTPLSAIKWYAEIMLKRSGPLTKKQREYIMEIARSNERAINLVNDLLDVSRIQEGQIHLELRPLRVEKLVEDVIDNYDSMITAAHVKIDFEISGGPLPVVETDPDKLKRVVGNLLSNAVKYTPPGGKVRIAVEKKGNNLLTSVTDSGVGIPKSDHSKIFGKFFRSANVLKLSSDGTGLGLFIVKSLVETMGGKISFTSAEGQGTTFSFTLPLKV